MPRNEEPLHGGNATDAVMHVGNTVRQPWQENTPAVHRFMEHLRDQGLSEVPRTHGKDPQGRQVVEFVAGTPAPPDRPLPDDLLSTAGRWIRSIHHGAAGFTPVLGEHWSSLIPVADAELICHNDLAPWNLVLGDEPVFIDCDGAGPSTRLWDLAYAAQSLPSSSPGKTPMFPQYAYGVWWWRGMRRTPGKPPALGADVPRWPWRALGRRHKVCGRTPRALGPGTAPR